MTNEKTAISSLQILVVDSANSYGAAFGADTMGYVGFTSASPTMSDDNQRRLNPMPQRTRVTTVNAADARFERSAC
jgi:hypothetical protein